MRDLCSALVASDIPIHKVNNDIFKNFLTEYTGRTLPCEGTLRQKYMPTIFSEGMDKLRTKIGDNCIWVSMDETVDKRGRPICKLY